MQTVGQYQIDIYRDETFTKGSVDNLNKYDNEYLDESEYRFASQFGIKLFKDTELLSSSIIGSVGGGTGIHKTSVVFEDTRLAICCSENIFCLSIPDLKLLWRTKADLATCFEIYKYQDSYIIHGELDISRLDKNGKIVWQRNGADVFTTISGEQDFELKDNFIIARDFEDRVYKYDYDGNDFTDKTQF